jgi:hypothetical protein
MEADRKHIAMSQAKFIKMLFRGWKKQNGYQKLVEEQIQPLLMILEKLNPDLHDGVKYIPVMVGMIDKMDHETRKEFGKEYKTAMTKLHLKWIKKKQKEEHQNWGDLK